MKNINHHQDKKLGRGLSALLGESKTKNLDDNAVNQNNNARSLVVETIPMSKITAGVYQPRRNFNPEELQDLANSIKENGLIQPIIVRKSDEGHYEIIAGERRFRATKILGLTSIPAIVKRINNHEALELALIENVQRSDLSLIEEARGYQQLMDEFSYTQDQVAKKTGKSRSHIANILRMLDLPKSVQDMMDKKLISMGHARAIVNSKDPESLANKIAQGALTVREAEEMIRDEKIEKLKQNPVIARQESKIKFVNSGELTDLENKLSELMDSQVKISFNQFKNSGKITINFIDLEKIYGLIAKLEA